MVAARRSQGFTLLEVLIAVILVGVSIAALVVANTSFTLANGTGADISTAEFLVEQMRELTATLAVMEPDVTNPTFGIEGGETTLADYDDVDDFDNLAFSPPIAADRTVLSDFAAFSQQVIVQNVSASNFDTVVGDGLSDFFRITVTVSLNGNQLSSTSWIRARF